MAGRFEPKTEVKLDPPKDDVITKEYLSKCDGTLHDMNMPIYDDYIKPMRFLYIGKSGFWSDSFQFP